MMDAVVSARHLSKTLGGRAVLRDVSVDVAPGNIVGILGENGAGKTKESVVRLMIRGHQTLPAPLGIPNVLSERVDGGRAQVVVTHWDDSHRSLLARRLNADIVVESLSLEDIFLELHT